MYTYIYINIFPLQHTLNPTPFISSLKCHNYSLKKNGFKNNVPCGKPTANA